MRKIKNLHESVKIYDSGYRGDCPYEYVEQINAVSWFRHNYPQYRKLFFHVANESECRPQYRAKLSKMGITSGVSDLILLVPVGGYPYAVFEMKRTGKGQLSPDQKLFLNAAAEMGAFAAVACGAEQFKLAVGYYLQPLYSKP